MKLLITVDTEADQYESLDAPLTHQNLERLPAFHQLCRAHGFVPTLLCTHDVLVSDGFPRHVLSLATDGAEFGAHLHPWSTPPFEDPRVDGPSTRAYPSELTPELFRRKLATLTDAVVERAGVAPVSYRAGRWGFDRTQVPALCELGYRVDCSLTPRIDWGSTPGALRGGPDFRTAPLRPHRISGPGGAALLEVPMTILPTAPGWAPDGLQRALLARRRWRPARSLLARIGFRNLWLRPLPHYQVGDLLAVCRRALRMQLPALMLMIHSSDLLPGGSLKSPGEREVAELLEKVERVLASLHEAGAQGSTLADFAAEFAP